MLSPPDSAPPDVHVFNAEIEATLTGLPPIWEVGHEAARQAREEGESVFGPLEQSDRAETLVIDGPRGPISMRILAATKPSGIFVHIHGGGWVLGGAHHHDRLLAALCEATGQTVISIDYRLAPENPYPAANEDCEAAALWIHAHARSRFGTDVLTIGGESAGAHLAVTTLLRLRDSHDLTPFAAANLVYGWYDLRLTPSARSFGERPLILTTATLEWFVEQYAPPRLDTHDVSPLMADLGGLPPALFTVGTADPLLDDSLFMAARWAATGVETQLDVWPSAIHAFDYFDTRYAAASRSRMHHFLLSQIDVH
jgi:acetyl esterase/lipase